MKYLDLFLLNDIMQSFRRCRVAFCIDDIQPYNKAMASIRMRCYDVMKYFRKHGIPVELYKPFKKYEAVFFSKTCYDSSARIAEKLHQQGTKIYFESFCDYLNDDNIQNKEKDNILRILKVADIMGVPSEVQQQVFMKRHRDVRMIPESVDESFFKEKKQHSSNKNVNLIYCGYSAKAKDTLCVKETIRKIQEEYGSEMIYVCEKDPHIQGIPYRYIPYNQKKIPSLLMQGDIMIAPRPMDGIEHRGHSFTKAAYPLAVGLPVVASPLPSYLNTPVILCNTEHEWYDTLKNLIENPDRRNQLADQGSRYVKDNYSIDVVGEKYIGILKEFGIK